MMSARLVVGLVPLLAVAVLAPSAGAEARVRGPDRIGVAAAGADLSSTHRDGRPGRSAVCLEELAFAAAPERDQDFHWGRIRPLRDLGWAGLCWLAVANDGRMITAIWRPTLRTVIVRTPGGVYRLDCKAHPSAPPRNVLSGIQAAFSTAFKS